MAQHVGIEFVVKKRTVPVPSPETLTTHLLKSADETRAAVNAAKSAGDSVGFVPTMGALHQGHLSLVEASLAECDRTVVSIFINPTQFGKGEDLDQYPRSLDQDMRQLESLGCWLVFAPEKEEMYAENFETFVEVGNVAIPLEGAMRPTHFRGVATVVLKLLQIVPAARSYFGQKDSQQTLVVKKLVQDLNVPTEIRIMPIIREADGIAMSSRNTNLSLSERGIACSLWQALQLAEKLWHAGEKNAETILQAMKKTLALVEGLEVEYIALLQQRTVHEVTTIEGPTVAVIAARVGQTRLIDNHVIGY